MAQLRDAIFVLVLTLFSVSAFVQCTSILNRNLQHMGKPLCEREIIKKPEAMNAIKLKLPYCEIFTYPQRAIELFLAPIIQSVVVNDLQPRQASTATICAGGVGKNFVTIALCTSSASAGMHYRIRIF